MRVKNCIVCDLPAVVYTGHIHTEIGQLVAGWCMKHHNSAQGPRPRSKNCTSTNKNSCNGVYKLSELVLCDPITKESMQQQIENEAFSNMIDRECSPNHSENNRKSFWSYFGL